MEEMAFSKRGRQREGSKKIIRLWKGRDRIGGKQMLQVFGLGARWRRWMAK